MNVTENWDDDFEFNPNSPPRKKNNQNTTTNNNDDDGIVQETRISTASSRLTVDWDAETDSPMNASSSHKTKVFTAPNLSDWAEPGPSIPARRVVFGSGKLSLTAPADNWDDDFEDSNDNTPVIRRARVGQGDPSANSPTKELTRNFRSMQPLPKNDSAENPSTPGRNRASSSASTNYYRSHKLTTRHPLSGDLADGEDEEEDEFGFMDKDEEDKTLTGRNARRAAYPGGRVNSMSSATPFHSLNLTPPPPVPSLPAHLTGDKDTLPEPFPRSPSSSVFSLPTTIAGESVYYGSTAYLYPTASRTSSSGGGSGRVGGGAKVFSQLPPSPPIHKERERRRLRKKNRPQPQGVFELIPVESSLAALQEVERGGEGYYRTSRERERSPGRDSARSGTSHSLTRPQTPQRPLTPPSSVSAASPVLMATGASAFIPTAESANANAPVTPSNKRHSASSNLPPTPSSTKGSALLSRIGSVKKWGARRKRGGSISQNNLPGSPEGPETSMDPGTLARPTSSLSSLPSTASSHYASSRPTSPPSKQNWFFRNSDTFTTGSGASVAMESAISQRGQGGQGYPYVYSSNSSCNHSHQNSCHQYHPQGSKTDVRAESTTDLRGNKPDPRSRQGSTMDLSLGSSLCPQSHDEEPGSIASFKKDPSQTSRVRRSSEIARDQTRTRDDEEASEKDTPSKLLKRRSLGFVQLRKTITRLGGNSGEASDSSKGSLNAAAGQPRHASYGSVSQKSGKGRSDVFQDRQNLDLPSIPPQTALDNGRERKKSLLKIKTKQTVTEEKEGRKNTENGFIRSVRKISIVGRHKKEKSITSPVPTLPGVEKTTRPSLGSRSIAEETKDIDIDAIIEVAPQQDLGAAVPAIENLSSAAAESEAKEENAPDEETVEPKPIAIELPQTPPRKRSTVTSGPTTPSSPRLATVAATARSPASPTPRSPTTSPQTASLGRSTYSPTKKDASQDENIVPRRSSLGDLKIPARISQAQVGLRRDLGMVREFAHNVEQLKELQATYHNLVIEIQELLDNHLHATQQMVVRSVSPSFFSRPVGRKRSNTNPGPTPDPTRQLAYKQLASAFYTINSKYRITWECAELLIELGGGSSTVPGPPAPTTSVSAPVVQGSGDEGSSFTRRMGRERAITLAGDESKPPSPLPGMKTELETQRMSSSSVAWRASTGRQELSQRQMILLKELLNNADSSFINCAEDVKPSIQEEHLPSANKEWKWGDPSNSTITLPPSESSGVPSSTSSTNAVSTNVKNRTSRLGIAGLRDLLKMLKRHHTAHPMPFFRSTSSLATNTTNSSSELNLGFPSTSDLHQHHEVEKAATQGRRRARTSLGPEVTPPIHDSTPLPTRQSRNRPSLASIFRLPNSRKPQKVSGSHAAQANEPVEGGRKQAKGTGGSSSPAEDDWDQIDSTTDLDKGVKSLPSSPDRGDGMATLRGWKGQSPYLQQPVPLLPSLLNGGRTASRPRALNPTSSQTSLYEDSPTNNSHNIRPTRLSNVDEDAASGPSLSHSAAAVRLNSYSSATVKVAPVIPPPRLSSRCADVAGANKMSKSGSVRSMPPQPMAELRLAMTPENIRPLVENAKEVNGRLVECVAEIRALLEGHKAVVVVEPLQPPKAM